MVTRLYAIYESFVEDIIRDWLALLPELFTSYLDLEERIRNTHQIGVGRLLKELKKNRYEQLSLETVVSGLFRGITGEQEYDLLSDAFLFHEQNLRKEALEKLLADAGIQNAWNWIEKHRFVRNFVEKIGGDQNTVEGELNQLISYRNDAAHSSRIDEILGHNDLLELCDFIETLCQAMAELVTYQVIKRKKSIGQVREIGKITEWYKNSQAGVAKVEQTKLAVGDKLFLVSEGSSYCQLAIIESIKIDDKLVEKVVVTTEVEAGLKFDVDAKKRIILVYLSITINNFFIDKYLLT